MKKTAIITGTFPDDFKFPEVYNVDRCMDCPFEYVDNGLWSGCNIADYVDGVQRCPFHGGADTIEYQIV